MRISFTKMQGAGNDFVVLDETAAPLNLSAAHYRRLADRHFGVGADQILSVHPAPTPDVDFEYRIHNADGGEVEHCGNGARCFVRYVRERGLTQKNPVRVKVRHGVIELAEQPDGRVRVNMGAPAFEPARLPFAPGDLRPVPQGDWQLWPLPLGAGQSALLALVSMGNPHAVQIVADLPAAPVREQGPLIERHPAFARGVNAGFMQILSPGEIALRVWERGAGETLACGTGACAAVVAGRRLQKLDEKVNVQTAGGTLTIEWTGRPQDPVYMTGPAQTVFHGQIDLPDTL
ncbi:MAG: diaminopimelate epimerase [Ottowia sp.]